jgi:hypothetical protein
LKQRLPADCWRCLIPQMNGQSWQSPVYSNQSFVRLVQLTIRTSLQRHCAQFPQHDRSYRPSLCGSFSSECVSQIYHLTLNRLSTQMSCGDSVAGT